MKEKQFTYWISECLNDNQCYSIIGKTKKEVKEQLSEQDDPDNFGPVEKRVYYFTGGLFDFFQTITGEGGGRSGGYSTK
jgi:hypothetical protein